MYIVGFNGPPRCGKDTMATMLADHMDSQGVTVPVRMESLSLPLRRVAYVIAGWQGPTDGPNYEEFKLATFRLNEGVPITGRQIMIDVSEKFLKKTYGLATMAWMLIQRNLDFTGVLLVRDSGFQCEVEPLVKHVGADKFYIANVLRDGTSFEGDSREWVHHEFCAGYSNNGSLDDLRTEAGRLYGRLVNQLHWKL